MLDIVHVGKVRIILIVSEVPDVHIENLRQSPQGGGPRLLVAHFIGLDGPALDPNKTGQVLLGQSHHHAVLFELVCKRLHDCGPPSSLSAGLLRRG